MDILIIVFLFFLAWLGGHLLDKVFTVTEKIVHFIAGHEEVENTESSVPVPTQKVLLRDNHPVRLYVVPSATARH